MVETSTHIIPIDRLLQSEPYVSMTLEKSKQLINDDLLETSEVKLLWLQPSFTSVTSRVPQRPQENHVCLPQRK